MLRKIYFSVSVMILLTTAVSLCQAYPQGDVQDPMFYYNQGDWYGILGCQDSDTMCQTTRTDHTIAKYGCALTSMAMLYVSNGFGQMPDDDHYPLFTGTDHYVDPHTLNNYLATSADPTLIFSNFGPAQTRGFTSNYDIDWLKTTSNFYYVLHFLNGIFNIRPYRYIVPNYDCAPVEWEIQRKNGTFYTVKKSAQCFRMDWSTAGAMTWLDYDIQNNQPPIMKIKYYDNRVKQDRTHFVVIAGYDPAIGGDGGYKAYNPGIGDFFAEPVGAPKALNGTTQYGKQDENGQPLYQFNGLVTLYRFTRWWAMTQLDTSRVDLTIHSPVEVQITDPDENLIGYDPETKQTFLENPMSLYYKDTQVTALNGSDASQEPLKKLTIIQPRQGNYIMKIFGTGDGPYTIDMALTKSDNTLGCPSDQFMITRI